MISVTSVSEGEYFLYEGSLSQTPPTAPGATYRLSFLVAPHPQLPGRASGYVRLPGKHRGFLVAESPLSGVRSAWQTQRFYMTAADTESEVTIGAEG